MYTAEFNYHRATSIKNAITLLEKNPDAKLLAGGHSLIPAMKLRLSAPSALIDISGLDKLRGIKKKGKYVVIGAMVTHAEIQHSSLLANACPLLPMAAHLIGDPAIRNKGTIGGSIAHADPAADYPAAMLALDAKIKIAGPKGERLIDAKDFFTGMFQTAVGPNELLTEIHVPARLRAERMVYEKFSHPASRFAIVGIAATVTISKGVCESARVALTGAGAQATRLHELEKKLVGQKLSGEFLQSTCKNLVKANDLLGDHFASATYRAHLVDVITRRALERALKEQPKRTATKPDDLARIEGIGPKIAKALQKAGINTFSELHSASTTTLKAALEKAKLPFAPSLETWAEQAGHLVRGDEAGFKTLTDKLVGGRRE